MMMMHELVVQKLTCPCCGYDKLDVSPYKNMPNILEVAKLIQTTKIKNPYSLHWGLPSYEVCACCGFEFGATDDSFDLERSYSFEEWLMFWISEEKCQWFDPKEKPKNWDLAEQLRKAHIPIPDILT